MAETKKASSTTKPKVTKKSTPLPPKGSAEYNVWFFKAKLKKNRRSTWLTL